MALRLRALLSRPILNAPRLLSTVAKPAICAVQLAPKPNRRPQLEAWLRDGRVLLEQTLRSHRDKAAVPASTIVGTDVRSCFHWIHVPAGDGNTDAGHPDTVAIVFTSDSDLSLWRQSAQREEWLAAGVTQGLARDDASVLVDANKITLHRDDGSLGGWLPSDGEANTAGQRDLVAPPPSWKVAATVLLAMYPVQEANRLLLLPALSSVPGWVTLPATVQVFVACAWTCGAVTVVLLPHARAASELIGFIGGRRGCPDAAALASATGRLLLLYAALVGVGLGVNARLNSSTAPNHTPNAVGSAGVWSALSPRPTQDKAQ